LDRATRLFLADLALVIALFRGESRSYSPNTASILLFKVCALNGLTM
jgi:hypothetical protein